MNWRFWKRKPEEVAFVPAIVTSRKALRRGVRGSAYPQVAPSDLNADVQRTDWSADQALRQSLRYLRASSRHLCRTHGYARRFVGRLKANVVGPDGFILQNQARRRLGDELDHDANQKIENAWRAFTRRGVCTVDGRQSFRDACKTWIETIPRDGEVLVRKVRGRAARNDFNFAIQLVEAQMLDEDLEKRVSENVRIFMGVESNSWGRPLAYHLRTQDPLDPFMGSRVRALTQRIDAANILHNFVIERPAQQRGVPWFTTVLFDAHMLRGYRQAELVGARLGASTMGFYKPDEDADVPGDEAEGAEGYPTREVHPGMFEWLPPGVSVEPFNTSRPTSAYEAFEKAILRSIAAGLDTSYPHLSSDYERVNFASLRQAALDDRDTWRDLQRWQIEHFVEPIFLDWLEMAFLSGELDLPQRDYERFVAPMFIGRGWKWVDPAKDSQAVVTELEQGLTSKRRVMAERGLDYETVLRERAEEEELEQQLGLNRPPPAGGNQETDPDEESEETEGDD